MNTLNKREQSFLSVINKRLDDIAKITEVNEFSGKNIISVKSIVLQIIQNDAMTLTNRKMIILDILIAVEELSIK